MPRVFISYRRDDSAAHAGRIYDRLRDHFGAEQVFRDIDAITPGAKFAERIAERIENCDALIAIIGKDWLRAEDGEGKRRLDDPDDWVKAEIREALTRDKLVIPALVEGARMPKDSELPAEIAALAGCHAIEISESRFDYDTERLLGAVAGKAASDAPPPKHSGGIWNWINDEKRQRTLSFLGVGTAALVAALWTAYIHFSAPEKPSQAVAASQGGIAAGGNVTVAPGGVVNTGSNIINIGVTLEQYDAGLKRREQEVRAELLQTNRPDKARVALLEKELAAVEAKRQNLEQSLADHKAKLEEANQALEKLKGEVPADQLAQAQQALQKGESAAAEKLFGDVVQSGKQQAAEAAFQLGELANNRIDYAKAYEHYSDAARLQPDNPVYLNMAGRFAIVLGSYSDAQPFFEKTLKIREKALGPEHRDTAASLNNLAALYQTTGAYAKAEPLYRHALAIQEKALGPDNPEVAASLTNLASLYVNQGRYADAEPLLRRSLVILEEVVGHWSPATSWTLNNLGTLYLNQGRYADAEPLYQRALAIQEKALGPEHSTVATSMINLAGLYMAQGRYADAEPLYQRALSIREKVFGPENPETARILNNLALMFAEQKRYADAERLYEKAASILVKTEGANHQDVVVILGNISRLLEVSGRKADIEAIRTRIFKQQAN